MKNDLTESLNPDNECKARIVRHDQELNFLMSYFWKTIKSYYPFGYFEEDDEAFKKGSLTNYTCYEDPSRAPLKIKAEDITKHTVDGYFFDYFSYQVRYDKQIPNRHKLVMYYLLSRCLIDRTRTPYVHIIDICDELQIATLDILNIFLDLVSNKYLSLRPEFGHDDFLCRFENRENSTRS